MKRNMLLPFGLLLCAYGCKKGPQVPNGNVMPPDLEFVLLDKQGNNLLTSISTPIKVSWVNQGKTSYLGDECAGGGCTMVREGHSPSGKPKYAFYYSSLGASQVSASTSKTFYVELGAKTDTLFYDVQKTRPNDPLDKYDIISVTFNGKLVAIDPDQVPIYPLRRLH